MSSVFSFLVTLFWLLLLFAVAMGVMALKSYNRLLALAQLLREAASNTEVAVSQKLSLVNQLIDLVRNYQDFEQFTHLKLADTNTAAIGEAWTKADQVVTAIQGFAQKFPELRTNEQYNQLADSIKSSESKISAARERYNAAVREYNTLRASIPTVFVARSMGFSEAPFLEFDHSGVVQLQSLREFKTGDAARLEQLLHGAGQKLADGTKALASGSVQVGRALQGHLSQTLPGVSSADRSADDQQHDAPGIEGEPTYFYLLPGGVPQGPVTLAALRQLHAQGALNEAVQAAPAGSVNWKPIGDYV